MNYCAYRSYGKMPNPRPITTFLSRLDTHARNECYRLIDIIAQCGWDDMPGSKYFREKLTDGQKEKGSSNERRTG